MEKVIEDTSTPRPGPSHLGLSKRPTRALSKADLELYFQFPSDSEDDCCEGENEFDDELWAPSPASREIYDDANREGDEEEHDDYDDQIDDPSSFPAPAVGKKGKPSTRTVLWFAGKDNNFANQAPLFTGKHVSNIPFRQDNMPIDYFLHMFPDSVMEQIVQESNLYAVQSSKEMFNMSVGELKIFIGMNFVMTYLKYSRLQQYWSTSHGMRLSLVADAMPYNRFREIRRFIHFTNNRDVPTNNTDKLYKLRPVLDHFQSVFKSSMDPEEFLSMDEMMIPFKGRSTIKQYIRGKPHPWGFKVWVLAGASGYVHKFEVYQGSGAGRSEPSKEFGVIGDLILRLVEGVRNKNHKLFFDNLFTSVPILQKLFDEGILASGTIRANRLGGASNKLQPIKDMKKKSRGIHSIATSKDNITVTRWYDNSAVHVASTYAGAEPMGKTQRWSRKDKKVIEIPRPYSISCYNAHMGGVDLMDSLVGLYRHTLRHKRWYLRIFHHFLNVTIVNCWLLWKMDPLNEKLDLLEFKNSIATSLIFTGSAKECLKRGRRSSNTPPAVKKRVMITAPVELRKDGGPHYPAKTLLIMHQNVISMDANGKLDTSAAAVKKPSAPSVFKNFTLESKKKIDNIIHITNNEF